MTREIDPTAAKVRDAVKIIVPSTGPSTGSVTILERQADVLLTIEVGALSRELPLTLAEARALAKNLQYICRRITNRPDWKP